MFKKSAFTLAEVIICLMIISVIAVIMITNVNYKQFDEKANIANGLKVIDIIDQATTEILEVETNSCPSGSFMTNSAGTFEFTTMNEAGTDPANINDIIALFSKHLKFEKQNIDFCSHTPYCKNAGLTGKNIKGGMLPGNIYLGFELTDVTNCPDFYMPNSADLITAPLTLNTLNGNFETAKCWGKLYVDVNGDKAPNEFGQDVFIFGLNGRGIAR